MSFIPSYQTQASLGRKELWLLASSRGRCLPQSVHLCSSAARLYRALQLFWLSSLVEEGITREEVEVQGFSRSSSPLRWALQAAIASLKGINSNWKGGLLSLTNASNTSALAVEGEIINGLSGFKHSWAVGNFGLTDECGAALVLPAGECVRPAGDHGEVV